jgi:hypothetical protein
MTILRYFHIHSSGGGSKNSFSSQSFHALHKLKKKCLCIPATEAPSKHIFRKASLLLSKFRNQIDPYLADRMVSIKNKFGLYEEFLQKKGSEED